jgi:hypothetical protein
MKRKVKQVALAVQLTLLGLACLALALILGTSYSRVTEYRPVGHSSGGVHFVFADLDGDRQPDMALVEMQSQRATNADYSIRVKLSAGSESAIGINGPVGGLRLVARDVNGDDTLDLVVTSNLDASFIQVLLNDGHGNFRMARFDEFRGVEGAAAAVLSAPGDSQIDQASLECVRSSMDMEIVPANDFDCVLSSNLQLPTVIWGVLPGATALPWGRSPPVPVLS